MPNWPMRLIAVLMILAVSGEAGAQTRPDTAVVRDVAEEAYLYGFPMIVGYDVLYEFFIDRDSGSSRRPSIRSTTRRVCSRRRTRRSSRRTATRPTRWRARPARRAHGAVHARDGESALLRRAAGRPVHLQLRLHRQPGHGERRRVLSWSRGRTGRARRPQGIAKVFPLRDRVRSGDLPHAALQPRRHRQREEGAGRLQGADAVAFLGQPAPLAAPRSNGRSSPDGVHDRASPIPELPAAVLPADRQAAVEKPLRDSASPRSASMPADMRLREAAAGDEGGTRRSASRTA